MMVLYSWRWAFFDWGHSVWNFIKKISQCPGQLLCSSIILAHICSWVHVQWQRRIVGKWEESLNVRDRFYLRTTLVYMKLLLSCPWSWSKPVCTLQPFCDLFVSRHLEMLVEIHKLFCCLLVLLCVFSVCFNRCGHCSPLSEWCHGMLCICADPWI